MITAILVFILIVIAVALFFYGTRMAVDRVLDIVFKALDESSLTDEQRMEIAEKLQEMVK